MIIKAYISCLVVCAIVLIISIIGSGIAILEIVIRRIRRITGARIFIINLVVSIVALVGIIILIICTPEVIEALYAVSDHFKEIQERIISYTSYLSNIHLYVESLLKNETSSKTIHYKFKRIVSEGMHFLPRFGDVLKMYYNIRKYGMVKGAIETIMDSQKVKGLREIWVDLGARVKDKFEEDRDKKSGI